MMRGKRRPRVRAGASDREECDRRGRLGESKESAPKGSVGENDTKKIMTVPSALALFAGYRLDMRFYSSSW